MKPKVSYSRWCIAVILLAGMAGLLSPNAQADTFLTANLTNLQENPLAVPTTTISGDPRPASFGTASFILNDAQTFLRFSATVFNIDFTGTQTADVNDDLRAAHIHASPTVTPATNGPVVWGFFGSPFNDNNPNDVVNTPFSTGVGGVFSGKWDLPEGNGTTLAEQLPNILGGHSYINFHTVQFPGGEVRGNISAVPEPASLLLLGSGVVGIIGFRRFKK
jgi:CHRD domain/PEP-CTERM motif